jgi:hypothetical protein
MQRSGECVENGGSSCAKLKPCRTRYPDILPEEANVCSALTCARSPADAAGAHRHRLGPPAAQRRVSLNRRSVG